MSDITPDQPLTLYDRLSVVLYRTGLLMTAVGMATGCIFAWAMEGTPSTVAYQAATCFLLLTVSGITLGVLFLHLYAAAIRRGLQVVLAAAMAGLVAGVLTGGRPVWFYFETWYGTVLGGLWIACYSLLCVKEGYCFRLYEGYAFAAIAPFVVIAHLFDLGSGYQRLAGWTVMACLAAVFTIRKLPQPLHYDIGDKAKY